MYDCTVICRFDFETFSISDPVLGTAAATAVKDQGGAIGDCAYDQFQISGPNRGSPVICGTNTGQHSKKSLTWGQNFRLESNYCNFTYFLSGFGL